jgi:S1-C subfamily serine protease
VTLALLRRQALSFFGRALVLCAAVISVSTAAFAADSLDTIARVKASIIGVGSLERTRAPPFQFRGTGFVVGDGLTVVTNAHVLPRLLDSARSEVLAVALPAHGTTPASVREATQLAVDYDSDLALLKLTGTPLPALRVRDSDSVREGQEILLTGYPIGTVLGLVPATHRGIVAAITPIAIPQGRAGELDAAVVRRLGTGPFPVFQLDATAYPGNSGSPIYDPSTGDVLGIINMVFVKGTKEAALSQPSGITYAVPSTRLEALLKSAAAPAR